jgi:hypothetical protein
MMKQPQMYADTSEIKIFIFLLTLSEKICNFLVQHAQNMQDQTVTEGNDTAQQD